MQEAGQGTAPRGWIRIMRGSTWSAVGARKCKCSSHQTSLAATAQGTAPPSQHQPTGSSAQSRMGQQGSNSPLALHAGVWDFLPLLAGVEGFLFFHTHQGLLPDKTEPGSAACVLVHVYYIHFSPPPVQNRAGICFLFLE